MLTHKKFFIKIVSLILIFCSFLYANEPIKEFTQKIEIVSDINCSVDSFIIDKDIFFGIGSVFDDSTITNRACSIKYDLKNQKLINEKIFSDIDSFYKIISYNNRYFLLGAKLLPNEENLGRSVVNRGFTGILLKLDSDENIEKKVEVKLNGFGNVKDFQIVDDEIVVLVSIKNSTKYDEKIFSTIYLESFDTNLSHIKNLQLKMDDYLADNFYITKDKYFIIDNYHKKICLFNKNGDIEKCLNQDEDNQIVKIEKLKNSYKNQYEISAYNFDLKYALKQKIDYDGKLDKYKNSMYLYKIEGVK